MLKQNLEFPAGGQASCVRMTVLLGRHFILPFLFVFIRADLWSIDSLPSNPRQSHQLNGKIPVLKIVTYFSFLNSHSTSDNSQADRKSVVQGKSVDLGGRRIIKKKKKKKA